MKNVMLWSALLLLWGGGLRADAPRQQRLSLIDDASTHMGVAWTTSDNVATVVRFGSSSNYDHEQSGAAPHLVQDIGYVHEIAIADLQPDSTYHYSVGDGQDWSEDATFRTALADPCAPWSFVAMGDNRTQFGEGGHAGVSKNFPSILDEAAAWNPQFIINSGDLVLDGHVATQWVDYLDSTEPFAKSLPMFTAMGNHDDDAVQGDGAKYNGIFFLPRNDDTQTEDFFSYRYANALFVVLSTQTFADADESGQILGRQAAYLDRVLTENPDVTWRFVAFHHPSFTGGGAELLGYPVGHEPNEKHQNEVFLPIFDRHHVDFVISGHNHWYERFYPLREGASSQTGELQASPEDGTIYVTTGGAGAYTMDFDFIPLLDVCRDNDFVGDTRAVCSGEHHFVVFSIQDRDLDMQVWTTRCQNADCENEPRLLDRLTYTKSGESQCWAPDAGPLPDANVDDSAQPEEDAALIGVDAAEVDDAGHDAGYDASEPADAQVTSLDAGQIVSPVDGASQAQTPTEVHGCACTSANNSAPQFGFLIFFGVALWLRRRRF